MTYLKRVLVYDGFVACPVMPFDSYFLYTAWGFPGGLDSKELAWNENSLEKGMATLFSILAWKIP